MRYLALFLILIALSCSSSDSNSLVDENGDEYEVVKAERVVYSPIYYTKDSLIASTKVVEAREIKNTGKIYVFGNYVFINEVDKGIHVVDNTNPTSPVKKSFIAIPGNVDMAIRDSILYADSYNSLVAINITDLENVKIEKVIEDMFNRYVNIWDYNTTYGEYRIEDVEVPEGALLVAYDSVATEEYEKKEYIYDYDIAVEYDDAVMETGAVNKPTGTGGSMARFTIINDYLYVLSGANIQLLNIEEPADPAIWSKVTLAWDIETIFPYKDRLFVGSSTGMYVLDNSDPSNPELLSTFEHARSCDPVVTTDSIAYVTLRSGSNCGGSSDQLDVIDISDLNSPKLIKTYSMNGPYGLAVKDSVLLVCDGDAGLKVYNAKNSEELDNTDWVKNIVTYDVIINGDVAIVIAENGLYQYDITDITDIKELSFFSING